MGSAGRYSQIGCCCQTSCDLGNTDHGALKASLRALQGAINGSQPQAKKGKAAGVDSAEGSRSHYGFIAKQPNIH